MTSNTTRGTFFHRLLALYIRSSSGGLIHCVGPSESAVTSCWSALEGHVLQAPLGKIARIRLDHDGQGLPLTEDLAIYQDLREPHDKIGVVLHVDDIQSESAKLDSFLCSLVLRSVNLGPRPGSPDRFPYQVIDSVTKAIADHFDHNLRYSGRDDQWSAGGRDYFLTRVKHFVAKGDRIEFCLPAFPCKSSNLSKVQGSQPDRGEFIALTNLDRFIEGIEGIYTPGAKLWIISDGHVFSDCIGVDDGVVDEYGIELIQMSERIAKLRGGGDRVGFKSLTDLFAKHGSAEFNLEEDIDRLIPDVDHHIPTAMSRNSETCRRILMTGFQTRGNDLRQRIKSEEASILALYRGFSRFMLEDLDQNVYTKSMSRTQRRRLSSKVAFEMIQRNQAYSNLVELLFPHSVRLSIHAHDNSGPKFGIQMFGSGVRATHVLSADGSLMQSSDLLHIPTPWHNCVVEIQGHPDLYVTKSGIARSALSSGQFFGGPAGAFEEQGHYFCLTAAPSSRLGVEGISSQETIEKPDRSEGAGGSTFAQQQAASGTMPRDPPPTRGFHRWLGHFRSCFGMH